MKALSADRSRPYKPTPARCARVVAAAVALIVAAVQPVRPAAAQLALSSTSFVLAWSTGSLAQDKGSPIAQSSPIVATLDGQGPSVVVGDRAGYLYAYHLSNGSPVAGWPVFDGGAPIDSTPSVSAMGGSGVDTVFVGSGNAQRPDLGGYSAYGANGQLLWHTNVVDLPGDKRPAYGVQASLTVSDLQSGPDVFAGSLDQLSYALNASNGAVLPGNWPFFSADSNFSTAAAGDLYGTGQPELVMGGASTAGGAIGQSYVPGGHVRIINALGDEIYDYDTNQEVDSSPAIGGFLAGGAPGIVVGTGSYYAGASDTDTIKAFTARLGLVWSDTLDGLTSSSPALANVEGGSQVDVVEGTDTGTSGSVWVLNGANGATVWHQPVVGRVIGSVVAADITGAGYQDLLVPTVHGVEVLDGRSGAEVAVLGATLGFQNSPLVTDDPDGSVGITLAGYGGNNEGVVEHYVVPGSNGALAVGSGSWPMFHHDPGLSGENSPLPDLGRATPGGLTAQGGNAEATLSWAPPVSTSQSPLTGYNVYEGTAPGHESSTPINGSTPLVNTNDVVTGLANGKTYYFEVTAVNSAGEGAPSNEVAATTAGLPPAPTGLTVAAGDNQVALSWAPAPSSSGGPVSGYNVYLSAAPGAPGNKIATVTATNYTATGLQNGTKYYFEVTAISNAGEGRASSQVSAIPVAPSPTTTTTVTSPPPAPTGLSATPGDGQVALAWKSVPSSSAPVTGYDVYVSTTAGALGTNVATVATPAYTATGLQDGTTYYFEVTAINAAGQGAASAQVPATPALTGYRVASADGDVLALGKARPLPAVHPRSPVVGVASTPDGNGYWLVMKNGGVLGAGDARVYGSLAGKPLSSPVAGIAATPDGHGYWLVAANGGIFAFGDARFYGSTGSRHLNQPIAGMAATPDGRGYWLVASDGGIFAFGDARFYGSTGAKRLNRPIVGIASAPDGRGYWLVASDGGIFAYGDARFYGSTGTRHLNQPIVGIAATGNGRGYWLVAADGGVFGFGNAPFFGSLGGKVLRQKVVGIAA